MKLLIFGGTINAVGPRLPMRELLADLARAHAAGLRTRSARATVADTLAWTPDADDAAAARPVATLTPEREAEILASHPA